MIEIQGVGVRHRGVEVLRDVTIDLPGRGLTGIIGPPRCGKTTLLRAIAALEPLTTGRIRAFGLQGAPASDDGRRRWQAQIGMAFQNDALFDALSVFENVALPLRRRDVPEDDLREMVRRRLRQVGLEEAAQKMPRELSGGMRKRLGIARATVHEPRLGLFDDPVAGLDPLSASRIMDHIVALTGRHGGMAALVVSNDLPVLLPHCARVVMLFRGEVVYDDAPAALRDVASPLVRQFVTGSDEGPL